MNTPRDFFVFDMYKSFKSPEKNKAHSAGLPTYLGFVNNIVIAVV